MGQCVLGMGERVGIRVSFQEMIDELEKEELEGKKATSKTSASPAPQLFSILSPSNQQPSGDPMKSTFRTSPASVYFSPLHCHCLNWTLITSHLDYYNSLLTGLRASDLTLFQSVLPTVAVVSFLKFKSYPVSSAVAFHFPLPNKPLNVCQRWPLLTTPAWCMTALSQTLA